MDDGEPLVNTAELLRVAASLEGQRLSTQAKGAGFHVRVLAEGLEITPTSTAKPRLVRQHVIQNVLDRYAESASMSPGDYHDITFDSSYLLALVELFRTRSPEGNIDGGTALLGTRFDNAIALASELHRTQLRKGTRVPYVSHLLAVAALVLEDGGDEDEAIAALLHDAIEDHAERVSGVDIESRFGPRVRDLVEACTDTPADYKGGQKPDWKTRKTHYLAHLADGSQALRISLADKLHNARSILRDFRIDGEVVWERFTASKEDTLWYYRALVRSYRAGGASGFMVEELDRTVGELENLSRGGSVRR